MREIYDFDEQGRVYNITKEKGCILVEYNKYSNNMLEEVHYTRYLAIKTDMHFKIINQWRHQYYKEDEARKSGHANLYVYDVLKLKGKGRIAISYSVDKSTALKNANSAFKKTNSSMKITEIPADNEKILAYNAALKSVKDLYAVINNNQGFYAGLPWYFQFWTRDMAISLLPVINYDYNLAKSILLTMISKVGDNGRIPNRFPHADLGTADGTGWVFLRVQDLLNKNIPSEDELSVIKKQLKKVVERTKTEDLLVRNEAIETWMDTSFENDTRAGFRIEIQALWLHILKLMNFFDQQYKDIERNTRDKVKEVFYDGNLKDGKDDPTIRPNIFLAYYIYPDLLAKEEWELVFDKALEKLWLEWGGLSTIQKDSPLFNAYYTGEDNISYHRGDSWFYVNNMAAICMQKLNSSKYQEYINKIITASTKDILYNGIIGRPSELSSASEQRAEASLFQLWSAATYVELLDLVFRS